MIVLALKTEDGRTIGKIAFYCRMLYASRQGFYKYLANKDRPWKYQDLAGAMKEIVSADECNDRYGRIWMYQALLLQHPDGVHIPSERTVYWMMAQIGLSHHPKKKPEGITRADREAMKSEDLLKREFHSDAHWKNALQISQRSRHPMGNRMCLRFLTGLILASSEWQWKQS